MSDGSRLLGCFSRICSEISTTKETNRLKEKIEKENNVMKGW